MRLFLAIELPENVRQHLVQAQAQLAPEMPEAAMTRAQNLHVTLKFLGEVEQKRADALCESLSKIRGAAIELIPQGVECFRERGPVRIVAAGMTGSLAALSAVHHAIEQRCKFLNFQRESRSYKPHVTLARARRPLGAEVRLRAAECTAKLWPGPAFIVKEFVIVESKLRPQGSEYSSVARFHFSE
jgi:2'-5' RNA ligase